MKKNDTGLWWIYYVRRNLLEHFDGDFAEAEAYAKAEAKRLSTPVAVMCQRVIFEPTF